MIDEAEVPMPVDADLARRRRRRRRVGWIAALVVVLLFAAAGGYAAYTLNAPIALPAAATRTPPPTAGAPVALALPSEGASSIDVQGAADFLGANGLTAASGSADPQPMASISKLVTALVVLDAHPLAGPDDAGPTLTFSKADHDLYDAFYVEGATIEEMPTGSTMSLHDALELMLVASASNYAQAVAVWAFGSESAFLHAADDWMARNGLTQTTLDEPTGIDARNTSTPADLLTLGKLALANPAVAAIVAKPQLDVPGFSGSNTNTLLGTDGVRGIKTGTLDHSNLLYSSLLDVGIGAPLQVTGVILGGADHASVDADVQALLSSIRGGFHRVPLATKGQSFGSYTTAWGAEGSLVLADDASLLTWSDTPITATVVTTPLKTGSAGEEVGTVTWTDGPHTVSAALVLDRDIALPDAWWRLTHPFELGG
ncbi:MAG: D-alanyl-D-alanine carboxypeptidase [Microbacterium sp.]|nr:D-alanyl-D-alanine carboxypeptidase [Microbacterium sp.]